MTVDILTRILWGEKVDASYLQCDFGTIRGKDDSSVSIGECRIVCLDKVSYLCTVILNYFKLWYKARNN